MKPRVSINMIVRSIVREVKYLGLNSKGKFQYEDEVNSVLREIYGVKNLATKLLRCNNENFAKLLNKFDAKSLAKMLANDKIRKILRTSVIGKYRIMHDRQLTDKECKKLNKKIRKALAEVSEMYNVERVNSPDDIDFGILSDFIEDRENGSFFGDDSWYDDYQDNYTDDHENDIIDAAFEHISNAGYRRNVREPSLSDLVNGPRNRRKSRSAYDDEDDDERNYFRTKHHLFEDDDDDDEEDTPHSTSTIESSLNIIAENFNVMNDRLDKMDSRINTATKLAMKPINQPTPPPAPTFDYSAGRVDNSYVDPQRMELLEQIKKLKAEAMIKSKHIAGLQKENQTLASFVAEYVPNGDEPDEDYADDEIEYDPAEVVSANDIDDAYATDDEDVDFLIQNQQPSTPIRVKDIGAGG